MNGRQRPNYRRPPTSTPLIQPEPSPPILAKFTKDELPAEGAFSEIEKQIITAQKALNDAWKAAGEKPAGRLIRDAILESYTPLMKMKKLVFEYTLFRAQAAIETRAKKTGAQR